MKTAAKGSSLSQGGLGELKKRLLFLFFCLIFFRFGAAIPIPGLDPVHLADFFNKNQHGLLGMFNMFSGGALGNMTLFALGVLPYISSSIIIQMYTQISPQMKALQKEGELGRRKISQYTRYGTVILSCLQSIFMSKYLISIPGIVLSPGPLFYFTTSVTLVTGSMFLMWLGEQITERGIGNGISLIIFAGIASRFPASMGQVLTQMRQGEIPVFIFLLMLAVILAVTLLVVFFERAQRRITINYAKRQHGRKLYAAQSSHLPLKINMAGVIPVIFAQSILVFITAAIKFVSSFHALSWLNEVSLALGYDQPAYMILFAILAIFFSFFYTALVFNPKDTADNLKKSGAFIPGIRPGDQTMRFIDKIMTRLTLSGSFYLVIVVLVPKSIILLWWNLPFYFGGTSLLIVVVVIMDSMSQVQAHVMSHQYESLMKKSGDKDSKMSLIR